jgi:hypothetical protein
MKHKHPPPPRVIPPTDAPGHFLNPPKQNTLTQNIKFYLIYSLIFLVPVFIVLWCVYDYLNEEPPVMDALTTLGAATTPQAVPEPAPFFTMYRVLGFFNVLIGAMALAAIILYFRDRNKKRKKQRKEFDNEINYFYMYHESGGRTV